MDYAAANQGQLKNLARAARDEMLEKHLIENGHPIDQMVNLWSSGGAGALDYGAVNLGQLKKVAAPFYDQLIFLGLRPYYPRYPWPDWSSSANDYAVANLGQVKNMFAFEIPEAPLLEYAPGISARFWASYSSNGMVYSGIVAGDQPFQNSYFGGINPSVILKGGSSVEIFQFGEQYGVFTGILASDQRLKYTPDRDAVFKSGTQIEFHWAGFVASGTLALDQGSDPFVYTNAIDQVQLKAGTEAFFDGTDGFCTLGTLATNQPVKYNAADSAVFKGGTEISFSWNGYAELATLSGNQLVKYNVNDTAMFKDGTEIEIDPWNGYAELGTLSGNQLVKYSANDTAMFKDGTEIEIDPWSGYVVQGTLGGSQAVKYNANDIAMFQDGSNVPFVNGYASRGILSGNQAVKYNAIDSAAFMDNTEIEFSETGFVEQGVLAGSQPLRYRAEASANFQAGTEVTISWGFVSQGILAMDQPIYYSAIQSAVFKAGTQAAFLYGNLSHGHLATAQPLFHSGTQTHVYPSGQVLWFDMPGVPSSLPQALGAEDSDQDGLIDLFEMRVFGSLHESPGSDFNGNGWSNQAEIEFWTAFCGTNRWNLLGDEDLDGLTALEELMMGFNPFDTDTDGDGVNDLDDRMPLDPAVLAVENLVNVSGPPVVQLVTPINAVLVP